MHELAKLSKPQPTFLLGQVEEPAPPELDTIPLPTEGQRPGAFFAPLWPPFLSPLAKEAEPADERRAGPTSAADALRAAGKAVDADDLAFDDEDDHVAVEDAPRGPPRAWAPGTYVWATRSKWHALDHLNMMMFSLRAQAGWDAYRARMRTEADARAQDALRNAVAQMRGRPLDPDAAAQQETVYEDATVPREDEFHPGMSRRRKKSAGTGIPVYPDVEWVLFVPPPRPVR
jgi:hypothetical protein